jgi:hypothetical protein
VLVSPSTVMQLKVAFTTRARHACRSAGSIAASVVMNASIVAMVGAIIPAPFAIAPIRTAPAGVSISSEARLDALSVVRIASAVVRSSPSVSRSNACAIPDSTAGIGNGTPITPVEATTTCVGGHSSRLATSSAMRCASRMPCAPVRQFALPLLATIARALPPATACFDHTTGAAQARLVVNMPATLDSVSDTISARSNSPGFLIPQ